MFLNFLKDVKIVRIMSAVAANSNGTQTSSVVTMDGFDSVCAVLDLAAVSDTATVALRALDGSLSNGSGAANIAGASATLTASTSSNFQVVVDVQKPLAEYVTFAVDQAVANSAIGSMTAYLYNAKNKPVTQPSSVAASTTKLANS